MQPFDVLFSCSKINQFSLTFSRYNNSGYVLCWQYTNMYLPVHATIKLDVFFVIQLQDAFGSACFTIGGLGADFQVQ